MLFCRSLQRHGLRYARHVSDSTHGSGQRAWCHKRFQRGSARGAGEAGRCLKPERSGYCVHRSDVHSVVIAGYLLAQAYPGPMPRAVQVRPSCGDCTCNYLTQWTLKGVLRHG